MRRAPLSLVLGLLFVCLVFVGLSIVRGGPLPPVPLSERALPSFVQAPGSVPDVLTRAGYLPVPTAEAREGGRRRSSFAFQDATGLSATFRDDEYPAAVSIGRQLAFEVRCSTREGASPRDLRRLTPGLVAAVGEAVRFDPAVAAGFAHLTALAGSSVSSDALRDAVSGYLLQYRQPSGTVREACAGCGERGDFADEYAGGPDVHEPLHRGWPGWEIAGVRRYDEGNSSFSIALSVQVPREPAR